MDEFHNRCAICGFSTTQLHHVDEDPKRHLHENLFPLCPNCHLGDYHGVGTWKGDPEKIERMKLFRRSKNPFIWDERFRPLWNRMKYLRRGESTEREHRDLLRYIASYERGEYYAIRVRSILIQPHENWNLYVAERAEEKPDWNRAVKLKNRTNRMIEDTVAEMLQFQGWVRPRSLV